MDEPTRRDLLVTGAAAIAAAQHVVAQQTPAGPPHRAEIPGGDFSRFRRAIASECDGIEDTKLDALITADPLQAIDLINQRPLAARIHLSRHRRAK